MSEEYPVFLGNEQIGNAQIRKQGLYWKIQCCCQLSGQVIYKVLICCGQQETNLGVLIPEKCGFVVETSVPIKRIGAGPFTFRAVPRHEKVTGAFVPIYPEEPFAYLQRLTESYLQIREGRMGIILPEDSTPDQPDSGQSLELHDRSAQR